MVTEGEKKLGEKKGEEKGSLGLRCHRRQVDFVTLVTCVGNLRTEGCRAFPRLGKREAHHSFQHQIPLYARHFDISLRPRT